MFSYSKMGKWFKELLFYLLLFLLISWGIDLYRAPKIEGTLPTIVGTTIQGIPAEKLVRAGQPFVLHFWGTWCPICRQEADNLQRIAHRYPLLSIAVQSGDDAQIRQWMEQRQLDYPTINDSQGTLAARFRIGVYPTTLLYDASGKLRFALTGYTSTLGLLARLKWIELVGDAASSAPKTF